MLGLNFSPPAWHGVSLLHSSSSLYVCLGYRRGKALGWWGHKWIYTGEGKRLKGGSDALRCANVFYCSLGHLVFDHFASKLIISFCLLWTILSFFFKLTLVYSVNVRRGMLVNGETSGDVLVLAYNVSHLSKSDKHPLWHHSVSCRYSQTAGGKWISEKHTKAGYVLIVHLIDSHPNHVSYIIIHHTLCITSMSWC